MMDSTTPADESIDAGKKDAVAPAAAESLTAWVEENSIKGNTIRSVWLITKPGPTSKLEDICSWVDWGCLQLRFLGGLQAKDIAGAFLTKGTAMRVAQALLDWRDLRANKEIDR